ncbi:cyclin-D1-1-like isoform X2 [Silene latifolia]|uniref:cyclin-D1-1-like isoform X2 n=1 Tax=Silene latifolia TaxID=37657 RepID=UPI003D777CD7
MSITFPDYFPDLLCSEESTDVFTPGDSISVDTSSEFESPSNLLDDDELSIAAFMDDERSSSVSASASASAASVVLDSSSRSQYVAWILKVRAFYGFEPVTAYLAVNYLDRFLSSHHLPQTGGWPLQLLSVTCLSLAAKMEEPLVPSLLDLQIEGTKFIFEPKTIQRMELLVLSVLDWRLRLVTPFTFISFFSCKLDASGTHAGLLMSRSTDIILTCIQEGSIVEYRPSNIAAAAILCASSELPSLSFATPEHAESWCDGLCKDKIKECYKLMHQSVAGQSERKSIKVRPQFRVTAQINRVRSYDDSQSSSSSTSSPSSYYKRRKLNQFMWVDDDF